MKGTRTNRILIYTRTQPPSSNEGCEQRGGGPVHEGIAHAGVREGRRGRKAANSKASANSSRQPAREISSLSLTRLVLGEAVLLAGHAD
jgi:hypothetical protein